MPPTSSRNRQEKKSSVMVIPEGGRIPPQSPEMEEAVLGAAMLEIEAARMIIDILRPEVFYSAAHQKIFGSITELNKRDQPIDLLTVTHMLKRTNELEEAGGPVYLTELTSKVVSAANIEYHARIVLQKYIQRELIRASTLIQNMVYEDTLDVTELLDKSEDELFRIAEGNIKHEVAPIHEVIKQALADIEEAGKKEDALVGVPSGFTKLDRLTSGWQKSELVIIAARPSMGKTAFALTMARNMAIDHGKKVAIFSLEMAAVQLVNRLIVSETEIPSDKIKNGRLSPEEWSLLESRIKSLTEAPIYIDDTPAISIFELRAKCRRLKAQNKLDLIIVDYLQLMTGPPDAGSREQEVSSISRSLKSIAKELAVPVLALSQLNRSVETRGGNKKPMLSDLRESGAIEQDADMVVFIHRPEKMGVTQFEDGQSTKGHSDIILAKNRNGPTDEILLFFREDRALFVEPDDFAPDVSMPSGKASGVYTLGSKMNDDLSADYSDFSGEDNGRKPSF
ncbi:MAG TPA: replicative DNA helicase [Bacteroidales bacterium]|nr:replicative DNA helicase [Bacteroidales bacterium]